LRAIVKHIYDIFITKLKHEKVYFPSIKLFKNRVVYDAAHD